MPKDKNASHIKVMAAAKEEFIEYGLPQLLCADLLYTRKEDKALSDVSDILTLFDMLGDRETEDMILPWVCGGRNIISFFQTDKLNEN